MTGYGGRPRDPQVTDRILAAAVQLLAEKRMRGWKAEDIAKAAGCSKAAIYRRWDTIHHLLVDVVAELGVRDVDYPPDATARTDLLRLLGEATTGDRALAEAAILAEVGIDTDLRTAYARGPVLRFIRAADIVRARAGARGEHMPVGLEPVLVAWSSLLCRVATSGHQAPLSLIEDVVDRVVLPGLRAAQGVPA